ncbi:MFS transporter [Virgibacillus halophilus]|uniref:MFS transporter n=1 Tax=Tigheibacillus halophilus TaxID=361280 RepID=UPI00363356C7
MKLQSSRNVVLLVFMVATFAIGMTEYVVTGLLTQFAKDFHVAISTTGLLLSVYAISVAVFGPIFRILTIKISPKPLLISFMGLFAVSNAIAAMAPNFGVLMAARLCSAMMHAPFFGLCMSTAVAISPPYKKTSAIAAVQGGLTIAVMIGVPFGSYLGGIFVWRYVFWFIVLLGLIALAGIIFLTPNPQPAEAPNLRKELGIFKNKNVLLILAIIVFGYSGVFTAYTFIEPMLRHFAGFGIAGVTGAFLCFGIGAVIGNFISGSIQPHVLTERLIAVLTILAIVLASFTFLIQWTALAFAMSFLFGLGTFGTSPLLNSKIIIGGREAPSLSGTIAASIFNLANSIGATLGSFLLSSGLDYKGITFIASVMILLGIIIAVITHKVEDKSLYTLT